jgi:hypothetical protein
MYGSESTPTPVSHYPLRVYGENSLANRMLRLRPLEGDVKGKQFASCCDGFACCPSLNFRTSEVECTSSGMVVPYS